MTHDGRTDSGPGVLFIGATGRGGSTLAGTLCGLLDGHCFVGELKNIWDEGLRRNYLCGCGQPFRACDFWTAVFEDAFGGFEQALARDPQRLYEAVAQRRHLRQIDEPRRRSAAFEAQMQAFQAILFALYRSIGRISGCPWVVDSSKNAAYGTVVATVPGLRFRMLHLTRDPRAVAHSWTRRNRRRPEVTDRVAYITVRQPAVSAVRWQVRHREIARLAERAGALHVSYESLVRDPDALFARLVPPAMAAAAMTRLAEARIATPVNHSVTGNPARYASEGLVLRPDEEWRRAMSPLQQLLVLLLTWPLRRRFGYGWQAGSAAPRVRGGYSSGDRSA